MKIPRIWTKYGREMGSVAALAIVAGAIWMVAAQWFGTLRNNGLKTASNLEHIIETKLGLTDIMVEPNMPKAGDVSVTGTVDSQTDADAVSALVEKWREGSSPSEIHMDVRIGIHNE